MEQVSEIIKLCLRARYSFAIWITGLVALLLKPSFLQLDRLSADYGKYVGAISFFAFVIWVIEIGLLLFEKVMAWKVAKDDDRKLGEFLNTLTRSERKVLARALHNNVQTITSLRGNADDALSLIAKGLIQQAGEERTEYVTPFIISSKVWGLIKKRKAEFPNPSEERKAIS